MEEGQKSFHFLGNTLAAGAFGAGRFTMCLIYARVGPWLWSLDTILRPPRLGKIDNPIQVQSIGNRKTRRMLLASLNDFVLVA